MFRYPYNNDLSLAVTLSETLNFAILGFFVTWGLQYNMLSVTPLRPWQVDDIERSTSSTAPEPVFNLDIFWVNSLQSFQFPIV